MTAIEAHDAWRNQPGEWPVLADDRFIQEAFLAGWEAHEDSLAKNGLPLGGGHDYTSGPFVAHSGAKAAANPLPTAYDIYAAYPRKVGKQDAVRTIEKEIKARKGGFFADGCSSWPEWLLARVKLYAAATATWPEEDKKFIPHPATWFNRGSYEDDPQEWVRGTVTQSQFANSR